jgi:hypothetical protein
LIDIWRTPVDGGEETPVPEGQLFENGVWVLWNHNIVFRRRLRIGGAPCVIDMMDLDTSEIRQLADLGPQTAYGGGMSVSPDGRSMLFSRHRPWNSDITLVENFR